MKNLVKLQELSHQEIITVSGGSDEEETSIWYKIGKFFAEQANTNDAINKDYGNTNKNHWI